MVFLAIDFAEAVVIALWTQALRGVLVCRFYYD